MSETICIREARLEDAPAVAALVTQLGYPATPADLEERLGRLLVRPDHVLFVAEDSSCLVGLVGAYLVEALEFTGRYGRLSGLVVDENRRGSGLGRLLMEQMESWLVEHGARLMILTSGKQRNKAHQFYRHLGYTETGLRFAKPLE